MLAASSLGTRVYKHGPGLPDLVEAFWRRDRPVDDRIWGQNAFLVQQSGEVMDAVQKANGAANKSEGHGKPESEMNGANEK